ncbi:threonine ammonia-lyase [Calditerricola satsumensis]|uniref:threonine ammonia-lyase n=2 Tax=Calditerricola satsumensis TaxID=373054 RepID=UPI001E6564FD|nr:threonine ammonia-lyase [Calditerricola satsumensis]
MVHRTPLQHSSTFSAMSGCEVFLKLENLQKTGAFKIRGAYNKVASLAPDARARGVITASAGNHAQGVAMAAFRFGVQATVVMPEGAPQAKIEATRGYGAEVVLTGQTYDESYAAALEMAEREKVTFIHAFDDPYVIAGQGTVGLEILEELPYADALIVPVGGGGLISGIAVAAKTIKPDIRIIGVQAQNAPAAHDSWRKGLRLDVPATRTLADGLAVRRPGELTFHLMQRYVDDMVLVSEEAIAAAIRLFLERAKLLVEGAGAAALAALLGGELAYLRGQRVVLVVSGGNVDLSRLTTLATAPKTPMGTAT